MRGKGGVLAGRVGAQRITPACAGKSNICIGAPAGGRDHPRVCGEKGTTPAPPTRSSGSPPRVRGKACRGRLFALPKGITPACAGKSGARRVCVDTAGDHPRVCGEKSVRAKSLVPSTGSPPRVRGKVSLRAQPRLPPGITPACAGKRLKRSHSIGHFSCILCLFHSVLHRASASGGSRAGPCAPPCLPAQNAVPV